jgi:two-component system, NtrC family, sensor histidine kinase PilS
VNPTWRAIYVFLPDEIRDESEFRKRVEWLILFRLVVTSLLLGATVFFQLREANPQFVEAVIPLYGLIGVTFLFSLLYALSVRVVPHIWVFSFFQIMVDAIYATVLVYFTGGSSSAFTFIYIFPIIAAGVLHLRRGALITATVAALLFGLLINLQFQGIIPISAWPWVTPWSSYTGGYVSWLFVVHLTVFFVVAVASSSLAEQLRSTKLSLRLREIDYEKLSDLHTRIVDSISSGIITTDEQDRITFVNGAAASLLGTPLQELANQPLKTIFGVVRNSSAQDRVHHQTYVTVKDIAGRQIHIEWSVTDLKGKEGTPAGRLVVFQDITQMKKMEDRVKLSEKQSALVRIAAAMAHEIRNPLASIRGATELLSLSATDPAKEKRLLEIVIRESDRLNALLGEFLRTVSGRHAHKTRIILSGLVQETVDLFTSQIKSPQSASLETLIHKGVEIEGDPGQLKQAFWHLLTNAAEAAGEAGLIRVVLEIDGRRREAVLKVHDSGPGIQPEIRDRIFEPFSTTKERGTGLGLAQVLSVVEAHGGTIDLESAPRTGTLVILRLPLASSEPPSEKEKKRTDS